MQARADVKPHHVNDSLILHGSKYPAAGFHHEGPVPDSHALVSCLSSCKLQYVWHILPSVQAGCVTPTKTKALLEAVH